MKKILPFVLFLFTLNILAQEYTYIDFSNTNTTAGNWNNVTAPNVSQSGQIVNLINDTGTSTGGILTVTDAFNHVNENGTTTPDSALPFPASATRDSFFGNFTTFNGVIENTGGFEITGLNPALYYTFKIFASRTGVTDNREALYTLTGATTVSATLNASNNTSETAKIYNLHPDSTGKITVSVTKGSNNNNGSGFYYIGAIQIITTTTPYSDPTTNPEMSLIFPNGGETWHATAKPYIMWNAQNVTDPVTIQYTVDNGSNWINLVTVPAADKKYQWTIPYNVSNQCKVRLTAGTLTDESENHFSIIENTDKRFKIVVLGSSTAAGAGPSSTAKAWVWLYTDYLKELDTRFDITNLAVGGYTTFDILPTGTTIPVGVNETIDTQRNITKAIALNADGIIVNMPSNDANMGYSVAMQMDNFNLLNSTAQANNIPIWMCNVQPRNFGIGSTAMNIQLQMATQIPTTFSTNYIDFWTGLANADGTVNALYNSGDGVHLNDAGHQILFERVIGTGLHNVVKAGDDNDANAIFTYKNFLIDCNYNSTSHLTTGNWNNLSDFGTGSINGIVDDMGATSSINVAVTDSFLQSNELGVAQPSGTNIFPANAVKDAFYGDNSNPTGALTFSGLNTNKVYIFELFASRKDQTDNRETQFTAMGSTTGTASLNASSNSTNTCVIQNIAPDASGNVVLSVQKGTNNNNSNGFYYLNTIKLTEKNLVLPDVLLDCEDGTTNRLAVLNVFSNGPGQSNADMVVVDNPHPSGINTSNKVVQFTRRTSGADAASWAGFYSHVVDPDPDFTENKYVHVKVLKNKATGLRFKIENGAAGTVEKLSTNNYTQLGEWEDMVIDFSEKTGIYATVGLQPDFESPLVAEGDRIIYFDDIIINNIPTPMTLGVSQENIDLKINLYPNPVTDTLSIWSDEIVKNLKIFNIDGRLISKFDQPFKGENNLSLKGLKSGFYIIQIQTLNGTTINKKIIKN